MMPEIGIRTAIGIRGKRKGKTREKGETSISKRDGREKHLF